MTNVRKRLSIVSLSLWLVMMSASCTTINIDQVRLKDTLELNKGDALVVLGRHQTPEIQTEASLVACIGKKLSAGTQGITVIPEPTFVDSFYPWFEARKAPLRLEKLKKLMQKPLISNKLTQLNVKYLVWVEGSTERTSQAGSMSCSIGPGGGGCFGFGTWEDTSDYETTIWDIQTFTEAGRVSTEAVGTSYMPAIFVPLPLLARVENDACIGMSKQLVRFFNQTDGDGLKILE